MGAVNLRLQNIALLLRWWWLIYAGENRLWNIYATKLYALRWNSSKPRILTTKGSFFWRSILKLKPLFQNSVTSQIISGKQTSCWFDPWAGPPLALQQLGNIHMRNISVADAAPSFHALLPGPHTLQQHEAHLKIMQLTDRHNPDKIIWNLNSRGEFSVKSAYALLSQFGKTRSLVASAWKAKATPSIKCFFFFLLNNRLLTHDVMHKRNISFVPGCVMCTRLNPETAMHLFFQCPFALRVWTQLSIGAHRTLLVTKDTPALTFFASANANASSLQSWMSTFLTATWFIWRERNERTFRHTSTTPPLLAQKIQMEVDLHLKYC